MGRRAIVWTVVYLLMVFHAANMARAWYFPGSIGSPAVRHVIEAWRVYIGALPYLTAHCAAPLLLGALGIGNLIGLTQSSPRIVVAFLLILCGAYLLRVHFRLRTRVPDVELARRAVRTCLATGGIDLAFGVALAIVAMTI